MNDLVSKAVGLQSMLNIPDIKPIKRVSLAGLSTEEAFAVFHTANPHIFRLLEDLALKFYRNSVTVNMRFLYDYVRIFGPALNERVGDYRLDNNFTRFYAIMIMEENPELSGYFKLKTKRETAVESTDEYLYTFTGGSDG